MTTTRATTRVVIVSRVYAPEVSAASWLLQAIAASFRDSGCSVTVVTTTPPETASIADQPGVRVRRSPALRDRQRYLRGYLGYLSFDLPLFFRLLFSARADLYLVEPPPTTTAVVMAIARLRRTPVIVDAADLWSDAAVMATRSVVVLGALRHLERWGLRRAAHLFAAHAPLIARARELGIHTPATPIGFGADTEVFRYTRRPLAAPPLFVYAGTHSEWHGAVIFVEAFAHVLGRIPDARLVFIGNGADRELMRERAAALGIAASVEFHRPIDPVALAPVLATATASLASLRPGQGYDYAFATKVYSSMAVGCPVIFTGTGPTVALLDDTSHPPAGVAVRYSARATAAAMIAASAAPMPAEQRAALASWASSTQSLASIARLFVDESLAIIRN